MVESPSLESRLERARNLHAAGYNCAQVIAMVMDDITGIDSDTLARLSAGLGGGIAGRRGTCGCVSVMAMIDALTTWKAPADKLAAYRHASEAIDTFVARNGSDICADLKRDRRPCPALIADAITIIHNRLSGR